MARKTALVFVCVKGEVNGVFLAVANDGELDGVVRGELADKGSEGAGATDLDAVNFRDDIALFETGFVGSATGRDGREIGCCIEIGAIRNGEFVGFGDVRSEVDVIGAGVSSSDFAGRDEVLESAFDARNGDGEADAVGVGAGRSVNTDNFASSVDEWAAGVAGVDGGVGLDHVGEVLGGGEIAAIGGEGAAGARDDAGSDSVLILAESIADSDDLLAGVDGLGVAESDSREIGDVFNFEEGDVVHGVGTDEFDVFISRAVVEDDGDRAGTFDDMLVGEDVAVASDDHASACGSLGRRLTKPAGSAGFGEDRDNAGSDASGDFSDRTFGEVGGVAVGTIIDSDRCIIGEIIVNRKAEGATSSSESEDEKSDDEDLETDTGFFGFGRDEDDLGIIGRIRVSVLGDRIHFVLLN